MKRERRKGSQNQASRKVEKMGLVRWRKMGGCRQSGVSEGGRVGCLLPRAEMSAPLTAVSKESWAQKQVGVRRESAKTVPMHGN